jgi:cellulose biosynthesis protein BcsE
MPATLIKGAVSGQPMLVADFGSVCAVAAVIDGPAEVGRFMWSALLAEGTATKPAWVLTSDTTPASIEPPHELVERVDAAIAAGSIKVLRHRLPNPTSDQIHKMLSEIDCFDIPHDSFLIVDCADRWVGKPTRPGQSPMIELIRNWARYRRIAVLLMYYTNTSRRGDRATELMTLGTQFSGIARLTRLLDSPSAENGVTSSYSDFYALKLLYWFTPVSVIADTDLQLVRRADGCMYADESSQASKDITVAQDGSTVVVLRSALAGSGGAPQHWTLCNSHEELLAACIDAQAATVVMSYERATAQDSLMRTVFQLRQQCGPHLKIIIRELQVRLRYNEEALIARLGANLIVPMEIGYARFLSMMEMMQNQVFDGSLPATYEQALSNGLPQQETGYLEPRAFAQSVTESLARSRSLAIDNVLVRLTIGNGLKPIDVIRHCSVKRSGDIYSCDRKAMFVFLFACREHDATQTLERVFALPIGELFSSEHRYISNIAAQSAIENFALQAGGGRLPDLSVALSEIAAAQRSPASIVTARDAGLGLPTVNAGFRPQLPLPVRSPLRRRTPYVGGD